MRIYSRILLPLGVLNSLLCLSSAILFIISDHNLAWLGAFVASGAFATYMVIAILWPSTRRVSPRMPVAHFVSLAGLALTVLAVGLEFSDSGLLLIAPLAVALAGYFILYWYTFLYGNYARASHSPLELGHPFPVIPLETLDGEKISSDAFLGSPTLIVFFRANWCTLCMAQIKEIRARADRFAKVGTQIKFISNQPVEKSRELAAKLDLPANMEILNDQDLQAASLLAIVDRGGTPKGLIGGFPADTVMATAIGLDANNRISHLIAPDNYRKRPDPDQLLEIFEEQERRAHKL